MGRSAYLSIRRELRSTAGGREIGDDQLVGLHESPECSLRPSTSSPCQEVHRFGECGPSSDEGKSCLVEGLYTTLVVRFIGINDCDQRSGIGEGHRLACARARVSMKAFPDFRARPPPP